MIKKLTIGNLAIIEDTMVSFDSGFNVITGETGAGKSLLMEAFSLITGNRAEYSLIRATSKRCTVTLEYNINDNEHIKVLAAELLGEQPEELILTRELRSTGVSRCFLNGSPVSLKEMKNIGQLLFDLHTQHSHHLLLSDNEHINLLDQAGDYKDELNCYKERYDQLQLKISELNKTKKDLHEAKKLSDYNNFVLSEIDKVDPLPDEEQSIKKELELLENSELIVSNGSALFSLLYEGEESVYQKGKQALVLLKKLGDYDDQVQEYYEELHPLLITTKEIAAHVDGFISDLEYNPIRIEQLRSRSTALNKLYRKYGDHDTLIALRNKLRQELDNAQKYEDVIDRINLEISDLINDITPLAQSLSNKRTLFADYFSQSVTNCIKEMEMLSGQLNVEVTTNNIKELNLDAFTENGIDKIEFLFSANLGESLKPLSKTASGGEMSRIMIAIKSISKSEKNPRPLILDEIDTGISGEAAIKVGQVIKEISKQQQIIAISHLPQIAAKASKHIFVEKTERQGNTTSNSISLEGEAKSREIARLFSGNTVTESALQSARELIEK